MNRKKFEQQGVMLLFKTKIGLDLMDRISKKHRELVKLLGLCMVGLGYIGMIFAFYIVILSVKSVLIAPPAVDGSPIVLPGVPLQGMGGKVFPLFTGWIALFIIMVIHEFSHGVVARAHNVKIKSSGIAFLGPILGAFVEPDDKELSKTDDIVQYSVFSAGPMSNIILALLLSLLLIPGLNLLQDSMSEDIGVKIDVMTDYPAQLAGIENSTIIKEIDGVPTRDLNAFSNAIKDIRPKDNIHLTTLDDKEFTLIAAENPNDSRIGYLGVYLTGEEKQLKTDNLLTRSINFILDWLDELFYWIYLISLSIGIINLFPIYITDGAQMTNLSFKRIFKKKSTKLWKKFNFLSMILLLILVFFPYLAAIFKIISSALLSII